ncbi:hypothetical protein EAO28_22310 [Klebsiella pneumoniae]|uniref:Uncharacterized protein n=1 Tax=Klebsiella pneumoniae TaxID=573 RepID=A0A3P2EJR4_KLEPN|nr:hypothetical protein EAO28_22310 [Klebsiella pneumoniae]
MTCFFQGIGLKNFMIVLKIMRVFIIHLIWMVSLMKRKKCLTLIMYMETLKYRHVKEKRFIKQQFIGF